MQEKMTLQEFVKKEGFEIYIRNSTYFKALENAWNANEQFTLLEMKETSCCIEFNEKKYFISVELGTYAQIKIAVDGNKKMPKIPEVITWIGVLLKTRLKAVQAKEHAMKCIG